MFTAPNNGTKQPRKIRCPKGKANYLPLLHLPCYTTNPTLNYNVHRNPMLAYPKPLYYLKPFDTAVLERVAAIRWLSEAGRATDESPDCGVRQITDKQEAIRLVTAPAWDDFRLEMRNEMTGFLAKNWSKNYTEWNNSAKALRGFFESRMLPQIRAGIDQHGLPTGILDDIRWDIVTFLQEEAFLQCRPPRFFDRLIRVYEQGHLPCSIDTIDSLTPNGTIIIY